MRCGGRNWVRWRGRPTNRMMTRRRRNEMRRIERRYSGGMSSLETRSQKEARRAGASPRARRGGRAAPAPPATPSFGARPRGLESDRGGRGATSGRLLPPRTWPCPRRTRSSRCASTPSSRRRSSRCMAIWIDRDGAPRPYYAGALAGRAGFAIACFHQARAAIVAGVVAAHLGGVAPAVAALRRSRRPSPATLGPELLRRTATGRRPAVARRAAAAAAVAGRRVAGVLRGAAVLGERLMMWPPRTGLGLTRRRQF